MDYVVNQFTRYLPTRDQKINQFIAIQRHACAEHQLWFSIILGWNQDAPHLGLERTSITDSEYVGMCLASLKSERMQPSKHPRDAFYISKEQYTVGFHLNDTDYGTSPQHCSLMRRQIIFNTTHNDKHTFCVFASAKFLTHCILSSICCSYSLLKHVMTLSIWYDEGKHLPTQLFELINISSSVT